LDFPIFCSDGLEDFFEDSKLPEQPPNHKYYKRNKSFSAAKHSLTLPLSPKLGEKDEVRVFLPIPDRDNNRECPDFAL
jgi:hypothetical protein